MQDSHDSVSVQAPVAGNLNDLLNDRPAVSSEPSRRTIDRLKMLANGFTPLPASDKGVYLPEWTTLEITPEVIREWESGPQSGNRSTGLRTGSDIIGIDIDVLDEGLADRIHTKVRELCGAEPPVRIGRAPKRLLLVRGGGSDLRKMRSIKVGEKDGDQHQVEILANGQQFVAFGRHPKTGKNYEWQDGRSPLSLTRDDLPRIEVDQLRELLQFVDGLLRETGLPVAGNGRSSGSDGERHTGKGVTGYPLDVFRDALAAIPNDGPADYEGCFQRFGLALHEETGGSPEGFEVFRQWAERHPSYSLKQCRSVWPKHNGKRTPDALAGGTILAEAFRHGWELPRAFSDDFADLPAAKGVCSDLTALLGDNPALPKPTNRKVRVLNPADPMPSARYMLQDGCSAGGLPTVHHWRGGFMAWDGASYRERDEDHVRAVMWKYLELQKKETENKKGQTVIAPFRPANTSVANVLSAFKAVTNLRADTAAPCWLNGATGPEPVEMLPVANGLLHLPTGDLLPATPSFFALAASTVAYDPLAQDPVEWLRFLATIWPDDAEAIDCLQEVFGYLLSADTSLQKIPLIVGPPRSGKGTIARVLTALLGKDSVASPTLGSLGTNFGLEPLIGKSVAIVSDARLSGKADQAVIAERLLSISGEDSLTIDRKFRGAWTGRLGVRFVVMSNELPRLLDSSGALASRFIMLTMQRSFLGNEDRGLGDRLMGELAGVLNWARVGYLRLQRRGYLVPPASSRDAIEELETLGSPVGAFVKESCVVEAGASCDCAAMFEAWRVWCSKNGRQPGSSSSFGRDFRAAVPGVRRPKGRDGNKRVYRYEGVKLNAEAAGNGFDDL